MVWFLYSANFSTAIFCLQFILELVCNTISSRVTRTASGSLKFYTGRSAFELTFSKSCYLFYSGPIYPFPILFTFILASSTLIFALVISFVCIAILPHPHRTSFVCPITGQITLIRHHQLLLRRSRSRVHSHNRQEVNPIVRPLGQQRRQDRHDCTHIRY